MPTVVRPAVRHPGLPVNALGLTVRDYEGGMSTLCAGCGHDSVTAALVQALWELAVPPHRVAKLSGIGCSAKTVGYFLNGAHGFNGAHGRMAPIATGAGAANRDLLLIGISGDGDSLSIGIGHLVHLIRRNLRMVYIIENNGVYGLTKGQFSPSADIGSTTSKGTANVMEPIDPMLLGLSLGATFLARGFSGDKAELIPILKAATAHRGLAIVDVISPCVSFNDHEGSTKSYRFTREHEVRVTETDFVPPRPEILASIGWEGITDLTLHDGSLVRARAVPSGYDPTDRIAVEEHLREARACGEVPTGILFVDSSRPDLHEMSGTVSQPLVDVPYAKLCPGAAELEKFGSV
ncbi:MAG TPA: 2-oxoacid:ferredoxin oxidoreductase subunit beta [Candidatus Binatia bacterium]|nr:2-oxoacid:ferredoxin oxidoreductase subunit beta [Candidatus Binatia bacterium]